MGSRTPNLPNGALLKCLTVSLASDAVSDPVELGNVDTFEVENDEASAGLAYLITADADPLVAADLYPFAPGVSRLIVANNRTIRFKRESGLAATVRIWRTGQTPAGA